jgi:hypothetical protein
MNSTILTTDIFVTNATLFDFRVMLRYEIQRSNRELRRYFLGWNIFLCLLRSSRPQTFMQWKFQQGNGQNKCVTRITWRFNSVLRHFCFLSCVFDLHRNWNFPVILTHFQSLSFEAKCWNSKIALFISFHFILFYFSNILHSFQQIRTKINNQFHPDSKNSVHIILNFHNVGKTFERVKTERMDGNEMKVEQKKAQMLF